MVGFHVFGWGKLIHPWQPNMRYYFTGLSSRLGPDQLPTGRHDGRL